MKLLIKEIAKQRGITLNEIAERVGIAQPSISRIINGVFNPKLDTLERIADVLQVNISDLFEHVPEQPKQRVLICPHCKKEIKIKAQE